MTDTQKSYTRMLSEGQEELLKVIEALTRKVERLETSLHDCLKWMERLRASGDAGNWDWEADEYTRGIEALADSEETR